MNKLHSDRLDIFANTEIPAEEDIPGSLVIYTDGSYVEEELRAGIGVFFEHHDLRFASRLAGDEQCIDRAEVQAVVTALNIAAELFLYNENLSTVFDSITIRTDSQNLIAFTCYLQKLSWEVSWEEIRSHCQTQFTLSLFGSIHQYEADFDELFEAMDRLQPFSVHFQKIKAHSCHFGNDMSDALSKLGRKSAPFDNVQLLESLKLANSKSGVVFSKNSPPPPPRSNTRPTPLPASPKYTHFIEIIGVPMHLADAAIEEALFSSQSGRILLSKCHDLKATRQVVACTTEQTYRQYMKARAAQLDEHISCPVNPGILQCSRCLALGDHMQGRCSASTHRCACCARWGHNFKQCASFAKQQKEKSVMVFFETQDICANCKDKRKQDVAHSVFSNTCPLRQQLQERLVRECLRKGATRR
ncbi:hypothetical protein TYRP_022822 [Tyrophagus putrescentiae]|nr:hypothetical protein TYRP_022822 [Tyrophagus putrescentiae]